MQTEIIGLVAAFLTTAAFLPQLIHTIRTRSTHDISFRMYALYTVGIFLWLVYGLMLHDLPLIASNIVTFIFSAIILTLKIRHG